MKLRIKVIPSSSKYCLAGWLENTLKIKVMAAASKGRANSAVISIVEQQLDLAKGSVHIESGLTSCRKTIVIECDDETQLLARLAGLFQQ